MKIWITNYALTRGIEEVDAEVSWNDGAWIGKPGIRRYIRAVHVHRTHEEAVIRAEKMRDARIRTLQRQIARLKAMTFAVLVALAAAGCGVVLEIPEAEVPDWIAGDWACVTAERAAAYDGHAFAIEGVVAHRETWDLAVGSVRLDFLDGSYAVAGGTFLGESVTLTGAAVLADGERVGWAQRMRVSSLGQLRIDRRIEGPKVQVFSADCHREEP